MTPSHHRSLRSDPLHPNHPWWDHLGGGGTTASHTPTLVSRYPNPEEPPQGLCDETRTRSRKGQTSPPGVTRMEDHHNHLNDCTDSQLSPEPRPSRVPHPQPVPRFPWRRSLSGRVCPSYTSPLPRRPWDVPGLPVSRQDTRDPSDHPSSNCYL